MLQGRVGTWRPEGYLNKYSPMWTGVNEKLSRLRQKGSPTDRLPCENWAKVRPDIEQCLQGVNIGGLNDQAAEQLKALTTGASLLLRPMERGEIEGTMCAFFADHRTRAFSKTFDFIYGGGKIFVHAVTPRDPRYTDETAFRSTLLQPEIVDAAIQLHKLDERVFGGSILMKTYDSGAPENKYWISVAARLGKEFYNGHHMEVTRAILGRTVFKAFEGFTLPEYVADSDFFDTNLLEHGYHYYPNRSYVLGSTLHIEGIHPSGPQASDFQGITD